MADRSDKPTPSRRGTRRRPIHGVLVAIDAPAIADQPWVVDAVDINADGMGLVLPPEIPEGSDVFLSFKLEGDLEFSRVPARVRHHDGLSGGMQFHSWPARDRLQLLEYLVRFYESQR